MPGDPRRMVGPVRSLARWTYHALRALVDNSLHPIRRWRAGMRQSAAGRPGSVLVLCHGNICRSPYAEARLRMRVAALGWSDVRVESAGFFGPGRPANEGAKRAAERRGIDLSAHGSRLVDGSLSMGADLVLVMTPGQAAAVPRESHGRPVSIEILGDFDPAPVRERAIPDPYGGPDSTFDDVFDRIDRCLDGLIARWS